MVIQKLKSYGLNELLTSENTNFKIIEITNNSLTVQGYLHIDASTDMAGCIENDYKLKITIPINFPKTIPTVKEIGNKIPRNDDNHVNNDDTICLGSSITVLETISKESTLPAFIQNCVVPYLYCISVGKFVFGQLAHGYRGILDDYKEKFNLTHDWQAIQLLRLLSKRKRLANKYICPCGCGNRLGKCKFRYTLNNIRNLSYRKHFKTEYLKNKI
jgi:hypothetical protein